MIPTRSEIVPLNQELAEKLLDLSSGRTLHQYQNPQRGSFIHQHCFVCIQNNAILGYAVIELNRFHRSECWFGPVIFNPNLAALFWDDFKVQLRRNNIWQLTIQTYSNEEYDLTLESAIKVGFLPNKIQGWATAVKEISQPIEKLIKGYDAKHRYSIERAKKQGLTAKLITDQVEFEKLIQIFLTMFDQRQIHFYPTQLIQKLNGEFNYIQSTGNGLVIGSYKGSQLLGGIILLFAGSTALYAYGAMNKNDKEPIMHLAIHQSFKLLNELGITNFDFGGYFTGKDDEQFIALNRFKTRFSVTPVIYPSRLELNTSRFHAKFLKLLLSMRNRYLKLKNKHVS